MQIDGEVYPLEDDVVAGLKGRAMGFNLTPNDVLRQILALPVCVARPTVKHAVPSQPPVSVTKAFTLPEFIKSERFQRHRQAIDRFLAILSWLHSTHPKQFADVVLGFRRGKRLYFGRSKQEVEQSGDGITAKAIPQSPFWVLATLDNKSKRVVLEDVLHALNYSRVDINTAVVELPDSDIRRRRAGQHYL